MPTIYQGKPPESQTWLEIPAEFVPEFRKLGHEIRELVLREDADRSSLVSFNLGVEKAAALAESHNAATEAIAKLIRALKKNQPMVSA
jgi:hypothetical protein